MRGCCDMFQSNSKFRWAGIVVVMFTLALGGCAKQGGDTTCADYLKMSDSDQRDQVAKLYKDKHNEEASALIITGLQTQASGFCNTAGKADSKIKEIPIS